VFLTTIEGDTMALDAHTGATIWSHRYRNVPCSSTDSLACEAHTTPAIDPKRHFVYAYALDGRVHKFAVGTGAETTSGGWSETATTKPSQEKSAGALTIARSGGNTYLYVENGGYTSDSGDYQGHLTTINLRTGGQHVFNMLCSERGDVHFQQGTEPDCPATQAAVWARAGVVYDASFGRLFAVTGNGPFCPPDPTLRGSDCPTGTLDWGDSVVALNPDGTGHDALPLDSFTPKNQQFLNTSDADLGSVSPVILPGTRKYRHLGLQAGKQFPSHPGDSVCPCRVPLYLLDLANLSKQNGPGHLGGALGHTLDLPQAYDVRVGHPAVWTDHTTGRTYVFIANEKGISAIRLRVDRAGNPSLASAWAVRASCSSTLMVNQVLFCAGGFDHTPPSGTLWARDPLTGAALWHAHIGGIHWQAPMVANGVLYLPDFSGYLNAFTVG